MRSASVAAAGLALAALAGCGVPSTAGRALHATGTGAPVLAAAAPRDSHGELAYIAYGKLYLSGGPAGAPRRVTLPGIGYAPAWSADGRWLAVQVSNPPPAGQPYLRPPAAVWLVNAAGTSARRLTPASWQIGGFAWAPHRDELAVAAYLPRAPLARSYLAATVTLAGQSRILAASETLTGPAWSPDGARLAVGTGTFSAGQWHSRLDVLSPTGGPPAVAATTTGNVLELAGWWPDGRGLLYWLDYQGSASIAADGLPLDSVALGRRSPRTLVATMLVHASWLAPAPAGQAFAAVSGGDRIVWSGGKQITLCSATGRCTPVPQPPGLVSVDPSWSPGGTAIAFARLSASGHADFTPSSITRWEATSRLWTVSASDADARPLTAAGIGALDPVWGRDGSLLFVRDDSLWLLPPGATAPARLTPVPARLTPVPARLTPVPARLTPALGALAGPAYYRTYYGYVPYSQLFAWTLAPPATAASAA